MMRRMVNLMNNYTVIEIAQNEYNVVETNTDQIITAFVCRDDAEDYCAFLNDGGAFNGFTPFFVVKQYDYINTDQ